MTPRFRQVAKHFVSDPTTRFGKFNCEAEYNERFCEVHEVVYMPTYVLFDEYRTTGHRFNPPNVPSPDEMRMWLSETLRVYVHAAHLVHLVCLFRACRRRCCRRGISEPGRAHDVLASAARTLRTTCHQSCKSTWI